MNITKRNQRSARLHRISRSILRQNRLCVIYVDTPREQHGIFSTRTRLPVHSSPELINMICEIPHRWTIYLAAFCRSQDGQQYMKSAEIEPQGQYKSDQLDTVLAEHLVDLIGSCNQLHFRGAGWIASPIGEQFSEAEAAQIFDVIGVWKEREEAA